MGFMDKAKQLADQASEEVGRGTEQCRTTASTSRARPRSSPAASPSTSTDTAGSGGGCRARPRPLPPPPSAATPRPARGRACRPLSPARAPSPRPTRAAGAATVPRRKDGHQRRATGPVQADRADASAGSSPRWSPRSTADGRVDEDGVAAVAAPPARRTAPTASSWPARPARARRSTTTRSCACSSSRSRLRAERRSP